METPETNRAEGRLLRLLLACVIIYYAAHFLLYLLK